MTEVYIIVNLYSEGKQILIASGSKWNFLITTHVASFDYIVAQKLILLIFVLQNSWRWWPAIKLHQKIHHLAWKERLHFLPTILSLIVDEELSLSWNWNSTGESRVHIIHFGQKRARDQRDFIEHHFFPARLFAYSVPKSLSIRLNVAFTDRTRRPFLFRSNRKRRNAIRVCLILNVKWST